MNCSTISKVHLSMRISIQSSLIVLRRHLGAKEWTNCKASSCATFPLLKTKLCSTMVLSKILYASTKLSWKSVGLRIKSEKSKTNFKESKFVMQTEEGRESTESRIRSIGTSFTWVISLSQPHPIKRHQKILKSYPL